MLSAPITVVLEEFKKKYKKLLRKSKIFDKDGVYFGGALWYNTSIKSAIVSYDVN